MLLISSPFNFLLYNPFLFYTTLTALLAYFLHRLLLPPPPPSPIKPRRVAGDVRRVSPFAFVFRPPSNSHPHLLLDVRQATIIALHENPKPRRGLEDGLTVQVPGGPAFRRDDYRETLIAKLDDVRVLEWGRHYGEGREVAIAVGEIDNETVLHFNSRVGAEGFIDVMERVRGTDKRPHNVNMFVTTFNVGNAQPPDDLNGWLGKAKGMDIIAIGAQECSYTVKEDDLDTADPQMTDASAAVSCKEHWHGLLRRFFGEEEYVCVAQLSAWDRCLTVFVRKQIFWGFGRVRSDTVNVGLGGVAGNKGAIGVRFKVFDTEMVILNAHLAAHKEAVEKRNEDYASISMGMRGLRETPDVELLGGEVHHVIWMGDLNYRIDKERDEVLNIIQDGKWAELLEEDQLLKEMKAGRTFQGFQEGKIDFAPTYRFDIGSRKYSTFKMRVPSYCDRILYRSLPGCKLVQHEYNSSSDILTSDHSPVYSSFSASLVHTTGLRDLDTIAQDAELQESRDLVRTTPLRSPVVSPRSLSMRALMPGSATPPTSSTGLQLQFKNLAARGIPEMDHGGRRIAVAKALHIHNHVGWKKHKDLGEGKHADPYCTFHGGAVAELDEGEYRTRTVTASQNPVWEPEHIPGIDLIGSMDAVRKKYLIITVKDEIATRRDDVIGCAVLFLGGGVGDEEVNFEVPIMSKGIQRGEVRGSYVIKKM